MDGIFSVAIKIYGLDKPNIFICRVPVTASEKLTSIDGLVSKLSLKLQQAAFRSSALLTVITFCARKYDLAVACCLAVNVTASRLLVGCNQCLIVFVLEMDNVSVLKPI